MSKTKTTKRRKVWVVESITGGAWRQVDEVRAERDELRAQVEAARAECMRSALLGELSAGAELVRTNILRAMDEAKARRG